MTRDVKTLHFIIYCSCAFLLARCTIQSDNKTIICLQRPTENLSDWNNFTDLCSQTIDRLEMEGVVTIEDCCDNYTECNFTDSDEARGKREMAKSRLSSFSTILDKTVIGIFLRNEAMKNDCMVAYREWICMTQFTFFKPSNETWGTGLCRPHIGVCQQVVQKCPYYTPARFQLINSDKSEEPKEILYGGLPAFMCPEEEWLKNSNNNSSYSVCKDGDCCYERNKT